MVRKETSSDNQVPNCGNWLGKCKTIKYYKQFKTGH